MATWTDPYDDELSWASLSSRMSKAGFDPATTARLPLATNRFRAAAVPPPPPPSTNAAGTESAELPRLLLKLFRELLGLLVTYVVIPVYWYVVVPAAVIVLTYIAGLLLAPLSRRSFERFKQWLEVRDLDELWERLRYRAWILRLRFRENWVRDRIRMYRMRAFRWIDRNFVRIVLVILAFQVIKWQIQGRRSPCETQFVAMEDLRRYGFETPEWIAVASKDSRGHYYGRFRPVPEAVGSDELMSEDVAISTVTSGDTAIVPFQGAETVVPAVEEPEVSTTTTTTATTTLATTETSTIREMVSTVTKTVSVNRAPVLDTGADSLAEKPSTTEIRVGSKDKGTNMTWCRRCAQVHCCH